MQISDSQSKLLHNSTGSFLLMSAISMQNIVCNSEEVQQRKDDLQRNGRVDKAKKRRPEPSLLVTEQILGNVLEKVGNLEMPTFLPDLAFASQPHLVQQSKGRAVYLPSMVSFGLCPSIA